MHYASCMQHAMTDFETRLNRKLALPPTPLRWSGRQDIKSLRKKSVSADWSSLVCVSNILVVSKGKVESCTLID